MALASGWDKPASKLLWTLQGCRFLRPDGTAPRSRFLLLWYVAFYYLCCHGV